MPHSPSRWQNHRIGQWFVNRQCVRLWGKTQAQRPCAQPVSLHHSGTSAQNMPGMPRTVTAAMPRTLENMTDTGLAYGNVAPLRHAATSCFIGSYDSQPSTETTHAIFPANGPSVCRLPHITRSPLATRHPRTSMVLQPDAISDTHGSRTTRQRTFFMTRILPSDSELSAKFHIHKNILDLCH